MWWNTHISQTQHKNLSNLNLHPWPRASAIKEHGFSEAVAAQIEAPQRGSTRSVYEVKWKIFTKWCVSNWVDFRSPPVKSLADFLLYLFQDRKLQPLMAKDQPLLISWGIRP